MPENPHRLIMREWAAIRRTANQGPIQTKAVVVTATIEGDSNIFLRPALLIRDGEIENPASRTLSGQLSRHQTALKQAMQSVGRVESRDGTNWFGTAWIVAPGVAITNRHVAKDLPSDAVLNLRGEHLSPLMTHLSITAIRYIEDESLDIAFLDIEARDVPPIPLKIDDQYRPGEVLIATVGYPGVDDRGDRELEDRLFREIYGVKRLSPGTITEKNERTFSHDCTTLGGSSGSVILDVATGLAIGIHCSGKFQEKNVAIRADVIARALDMPSTAAPPALENDFDFDERRRPDEYDDRRGYAVDFLPVEIPMPSPYPNLHKELEKSGAKLPPPLPYEHFTVLMHPIRRFALLTACNIDGQNWLNIPRGTSESWSFDPRIDSKHQAGPDLYRNCDLDRGHLTRRQDPGWGALDRARIADRDTFHFTNCVPQHARFNQRIWLSLEDYILSAADKNNFRISVFTGPIFDEADPEFRGYRLPREYWKVVAWMEDGSLRSAAYLLTQEALIRDLELVYGRFDVFQVSIARVSQKARIDFGVLEKSDVLDGESAPIRRIKKPADLVLKPLSMQ